MHFSQQGGGISVKVDMFNRGWHYSHSIPYSRKYWREKILELGRLENHQNFPLKILQPKPMFKCAHVLWQTRWHIASEGYQWCYYKLR